jgi:hypothetical protein
MAVGALLVAALIAACTASPTVPPSAQPSATASEADEALPPGCEPINLTSPTGERINLEGTWEGQEMTWWIETAGNCVWGAGLIPSVLTAPNASTLPHMVQSLNGYLGSDFVITGEILNLAVPVAPGSPWAELRMLVSFDEAGEIILREDREPGVLGPRCPSPDLYCPAPLVLERVGRAD